MLSMFLVGPGIQLSCYGLQVRAVIRVRWNPLVLEALLYLGIVLRADICDH